MNRRIPSRIAVTFGAALILALTGFGASAQTGDSVQFQIPPQPLSDALILFGDQSGQGVMADSVATETLNSPGYTGEAVPEIALRQLLEGTGLTYRQDGDVFVIVSPASSSIAGQNTVGQRRPGIEEIIVTGQKREERIQDVPIAISAFSPEDLEAQKIEGGFDLLKGVPNVTFSKTNFSGYNFQIRGIGTQAISATTDPGVAVSFNNTTLIVNRLFEQEYLDVERVEVLRGPQGTLFGRNATSGVINVISKKPELGVWDGMLDVEVGNYNTRRLRGFFNAPIGDTFAIRGAYASTQRDGYGINEAASDPAIDPSNRPDKDVDNRDLWTGRITLGWQPIDRLRFNFIWERFEENDNRVRTSKQLCHHDPGPDFDEFLPPNAVAKQSPLQTPNLFSQGCLPGSLYSDGAYTAPNGGSLPPVFGSYFASVLGGLMGFLPESCDPTNPFGIVATILNFCSGIDPYNPPGEVRIQSQNLRTIYSLLEPQYRAEADIFELSFDLDWTDDLLFSSQTVYMEDEYYATQDFNRFETNHGVFLDTSQPGIIPFWREEVRYIPNGFFPDPQLGPADSMVAQDLSEATSRQFNQEFRLGSSYDGPWNFSLGANYTRFETVNDYFVFSNLFTMLARSPLYKGPNSSCFLEGFECIYIDPNPLEEINGEGHNYFRSTNPYELTSTGLFGELYWRATDTVKFTLGLRMTWDQKIFSPVPSQLLLYDYRELGVISFQTGEHDFQIPEGAGPEACNLNACAETGNAVGGRGYPANPDIIQEWREPTGRFVVDWQPVLDFTDETLVYASFSHGYKGGGANPPSVAPPSGLYIQAASGAEASPTFEPEFVNAYEIGTKNTLFGGAVVLNGAAFYYDYTDYQVSKIVNRAAANENFDAKVWGLELESIFAPSLNWQFNTAIGYLQTKVGSGQGSIDVMDRTQGGNRSFGDWDEWMITKPWITQTSNCIAPVVLVQQAYTSASEVPGKFCLGGTFAGDSFVEGDGVVPGTQSGQVPGTNMDWEDHPAYDEDAGGVFYDPLTDAPNAGSGFAADLSGNELPNAPEFTFSLGGQYNFDLTPDWRATARVDYYWQDKSFARIYNTEYDRLKSWSNTNLSFWVNNAQTGITVEAYVKNVFDETPITGTFTNADDAALTTNVFTLDPRLIGVSVRKEF